LPGDVCDSPVAVLDEVFELVLVDRGVTAAAARALGRDHGLEVRRVGWDDKQPVFRPIRHAWRVEVAHGRLGRSRRLAKSFENTTTSATGWLQVACIATTLRHLSRAPPARRGAECGMSGHAYGWSTERIVEPGKGLGSPFSAVWTPIRPAAAAD
jgi:hypothetical protein